MNTRTRVLREMFGTVNGQMRPVGTTMQYASVSPRTLRRWERIGLIRRVGNIYMLTEIGRGVGEGVCQACVQRQEEVR